MSTADRDAAIRAAWLAPAHRRPTQEGLARAFGVSQATVSRVLNADTAVARARVQRLARLAGKLAVMTSELSTILNDLEGEARDERL